MPCHLLCLFIVICFVFVFNCLFFCFFFHGFSVFFYFHGFSGVFFVLFLSLIALGTSSFHLVMSPLWVLVAQHLRFEVGYRRVVRYAIDDLGKRET